MRLAIYKSAAKLTVRLTPHRHPLAALAGAEAKRTPVTNKQNKTKRKHGGAEPSPLIRFGDRLPLFPPRIAFFHRVFMLLFVAVTGRRAM